MLAVAASTSTGVRSVGVDLESLAPDPRRCAPSKPVRRGRASGLAACPPRPARAGFALKESLYKCLQPLVGGWIELRMRGSAGAAILHSPPRLTLRKTLAPAFPAGHELQGSVGFFKHVVAAVAC